jgi:excisionase family DNA binding protein
MEQKRLTLTVEEAADLLGIGRSLAYRLAASGELPTVRLGRRIVVPADALNHWLAEVGAPASAH